MEKYAVAHQAYNLDDDSNSPPRSQPTSNNQLSYMGKWDANQMDFKPYN